MATPTNATADIAFDAAAASSVIAGVVVFPDGCAEVTRTFTLHLPAAGRSSVSISNLFEEELASLRGQREIVERQMTALADYGASVKADTANIETFIQFVDVLGGKGGQFAKQAQDLDVKITELEERAAELKDAQSVGEANWRRLGARVSVVLQTAVPTPVTLDLVYFCVSPSIRWSPVYDLRVSTGPDGRPTKAVEVHFRAVIAQTTGEDWRGCAVSLSTVKAHAGAVVIPRHGSVKVAVSGPKNRRVGGAPPPVAQMPSQHLLQQQQQQQQQLRQAVQMQMQMQQGPPPLQGPPPPPPPPRRSHHYPSLGDIEAGGGYEVVEGGAGDSEAEVGAQEFVDFEAPLTTLTDNAVGGVFLIDGASTIPSDAATHKVMIAVLKCQSLVRWIAVPHVAPGAVFYE
ncbi:hypothetical protein HK405_007158, partial [Cladochytrium tenue]